MRLVVCYENQQEHEHQDNKKVRKQAQDGVEEGPWCSDHVEELTAAW
jgi:hypothetical protein